MVVEFALERVIIACQPSHGLDIGSIDFVHKQLLIADARDMQSF